MEDKPVEKLFSQKLEFHRTRIYQKAQGLLPFAVKGNGAGKDLVQQNQRFPASIDKFYT